MRLFGDYQKKNVLPIAKKKLGKTASKLRKDNKMHEPHIKRKLKKLQEKLKIPSSNVSLFITNGEATNNR